MSDAVPASTARVLNFDEAGFAAACAELLRRTLAHYRPEAIIAIPTGGLYVAKAMASEASGIPILPLTCRRPTSGNRARSVIARSLVAMLPRPALDRLRVVEHALLTRASRTIEQDRQLDDGELAGLSRWLATAGPSPSLLVVDDAVDSGATLSTVLAALSALCPPAATIRSAVISVTTDNPWVEPTIALYRRQLCRFPWSLDAIPRRY